jgi:phenylalanyl-tRNA synthetase alpha chain
LNIIETIQIWEEEFQNLVKAASTIEELEKIQILYLGRKGKIRDLFQGLVGLSNEDKRTAGDEINQFKDRVNQYLSLMGEHFNKPKASVCDESNYDFTLPGKPFMLGRKHPLSLIIDELYNLFRSLNFSVIDGFEIEDDYHNFEALNIPKWHPSRKMWDTFFINENTLLRTHTSPVQIRAMEHMTPPFRIVTIGGRCYRKEATDASHSAVFHQMEGLVIDKDLSLGDLSGILKEMMFGLFGKELTIRFNPSYFPFVEPGAETLVSCPFCNRKGCTVCQNSGWIELGGSGMVHPQVLRNVNIDPTKFRAFAFGWGIERLAMIKYGIDDIRLFFDNNVSFLNQF